MPVMTLQIGTEPAIRLPLRPGDTIDAAFTRAGYARRRKGCRRGGCGQCLITVLNGSVTDDRPVAVTVLPPAQRAAGGALACRAVPQGDVVVRADAGSIRCVSPLQKELALRELARITTTTLQEGS